MTGFQINSLQQRLIIFLLMPVSVLLFVVGAFGWYFARSTLMEQWQEASVLKLQRAAHFIDMRLERPMEWIEAFQRSGGLTGSRFSQEQILEKLRSLEGVVRADLHWTAENAETPGISGPGMGMGMGRSMGPMMRFSRSRISGLSLPQYNADQGTETVTLSCDLLDDDGDELGRLEVEIRFTALLKDIFRMGWWQSETAYITDTTGKILLDSGADSSARKQLGETGDPLELRLLEKMKQQSFGTVLGPGHPPEQVAGFCRTEDAGWNIVLVAPGSQILAPIVRFRNGYFLAGGAVILLVLVLIRFSAGRMVQSVRSISDAAGRIARGEYAKVADSGSGDEIGRLARSFNEMVEGLKERDFIRQTFGRYMDHEVARRLLAQPSAARLGGQKREVAILMSDIRGFTPMAETLSPEATLRILNRYFGRMIGVVENHGGIIVDFFGDAVLVFFDPFDGPLKPLVIQAVRCGLGMQVEMKRLRSEMDREGLPVFEMGIGVHAGEVVVGNIGSEARAKYGIVGTAVNLTQRIQAASEGGQVVVSDPVVRCAADCLTIERTFSADLKGIREPVRLAVVRGCTESEKED